MTKFEGVVAALGQALSERGYSELTPVQKAVLAPELKDADTLVSAQTGSGKTVAFGLAVAPTLLQGAERFGRATTPLALVIAPTRELALQVKRELQWLYHETGASITSCVGGMDMRTERLDLKRGAHIVVGTPGRLRDHIERGSFDTTALKAVVLDEADEMLDLGFRDDLEYILDAAPNDRRTLMFSATVPRSIATLAKRYQRGAVRVSATGEREQHLDIEYRALTVAPNDRENAIINLLRYFDAKNALVFCSTRATVNHMTARFNNRGFSVVALSGELSQAQRSHALQAMRDGRARVCVATDVAARGIDLPNLELVIHADLPKNREGLLHRSGRTGRAGRKGTSALIVPYNQRKRAESLLRSANVEATWATPPSVNDIMKRDRARILDDPIFSDAMSDDEKTFAAELLARHSAEQIACAFTRLQNREQPAPEELIPSGPQDRKESARPSARREDFKNSVWLSLSVGHKHNAEPRWLLPMLCRAGHFTKREIGAIKIKDEETHVEIAANSVDQLLKALGPNGTLEKNISVTRLGGAPGESKAAAKPAFKPKAEFKPKPADDGPSDTHKPGFKKDKKSKKDKKTKKPKWSKEKRELMGHKPKSSKRGGKKVIGAGPAPGSSPLKRKNPRLKNP